MTVLTTTSQVLCLGDGSTSTFNYGFLVPGSTSTDQTNFRVTYTDLSGTVTVLNTSQYSVTGVNSPSGGTLTFQVNSAAIPSGTTLLIQRVVPYTQPDSISNQGNFYPQSVEDALDNLELQIQQLVGQNNTVNWRGTWAVSTSYIVGDFVVDGAAGNNTQNIYFCTADNVSSSSFTTDVNAGDWSLAINFALQPYEMKFGAIGVLSDAQIVGYWNVTSDCTIPANFGAVTTAIISEFSAVANATGSTVFTFDKRTANPGTFSNEGTITIAAGTVTPTGATSGGLAISLVKGDVVRIAGPATHDGTLASPTFNIVASRP